MTALLGKTKLPSKLLGIVNCTPYDCWVERACMQPLGTNLVILLNKTIFQVSRIYKTYQKMIWCNCFWAPAQSAYNYSTPICFQIGAVPAILFHLKCGKENQETKGMYILGWHNKSCMASTEFHSSWKPIITVLASANWRLPTFMPGYKAISLSFGKNNVAVEFCSKTVALELMQDFSFQTLLQVFAVLTHWCNEHWSHIPKLWQFQLQICFDESSLITSFLHSWNFFHFSNMFLLCSHVTCCRRGRPDNTPWEMWCPMKPLQWIHRMMWSFLTSASSWFQSRLRTSRRSPSMRSTRSSLQLRFGAATVMMWFLEVTGENSWRTLTPSALASTGVHIRLFSNTDQPSEGQVDMLSSSTWQIFPTWANHWSTSRYPLKINVTAKLFSNMGQPLVNK